MYYLYNKLLILTLRLYVVFCYIQGRVKYEPSTSYNITYLDHQDTMFGMPSQDPLLGTFQLGLVHLPISQSKLKRALLDVHLEFNDKIMTTTSFIQQLIINPKEPVKTRTENILIFVQTVP